MPRPTSRLENDYRNQGYQAIAGLDEAGKGAWAGPVVAAAVILPEKVQLPKLNDSKLLTAPLREELYQLITDQAVSYGIGIRRAYEVDEIGLGEAHRQAMRDAVAQLSVSADILLVDGKGIKQLGVETVCVVKGDQRVRCIAAASILAKVTRDRLMAELGEKHPDYGFAAHKGYGTKKHEEAIAKHGPCDIHRLSYTPVYQYWQANLFQLV
jgi:ribonuclease HII